MATVDQCVTRHLPFLFHFLSTHCHRMADSEDNSGSVADSNYEAESEASDVLDFR